MAESIFNIIPRIGYLLALVAFAINPAQPVSPDELQYLALRGRIAALEVKLSTEEEVSTRLKAYLAELKTEHGKNYAVLVDPRNILSVVEKTRARNAEITGIIGQIQADLSAGLDPLEVAGNEQTEIEGIFFGSSLYSDTTTPKD